MTATILQVRSLQAQYGAAKVLYDVALELRKGEVVALMGRNGAGKSTTLKAIMGMIDRRSGTVEFMGRDISRARPHEIARLGLGFVPEDRRIFTDLTVEENLEVGRKPPCAGMGEETVEPWTLERVYALFPNLAEARRRAAGRMSGGEQQMLTVARTLMGNCTAILLDEPSEGVAPIIVEQLADAIISLKTSGVSMVLSEQNIPFAALIADRAYVLDRGEIRYEGAMRELQSDETLRRTYLEV